MATQKPKKRKKSSQCRQKNLGALCPGKYVISYDNNSPIFTCDTCGHVDNTWKKFYEEYLQLFRVKDNWAEPKNHVTCLIGFFCHMYKEFYGTEYVFVPAGPNPYSAKECRDAWALLSAFSGDADEARKYVYWVFKKRITKTTEITSFGYLNAPGLVRKYKLIVAQKKTLTRASELPSAFLSWCRETVPTIFDRCSLKTMNDLGALLGYVKKSTSLAADSTERVAIDGAVKFGLIKEDKLSVGD